MSGSLTPRERDVLLSAASGRTVRETGRELHISEHTVKKVRRAACVRLDAGNVVEAVWKLSRL